MTTQVNSTNALLAARLAQAKTNESDQAEKTVEVTEKMFQEYKSSRAAVRIVTNKGIQCIFNGSRFFTDDAEVIAYLDAEIAKAPMLGVTKGDLVPSSARDPNKAYMDELREQIRKEERERILAEINGERRDFGSYRPAEAGSGMTTSENVIGN